MSLLNKKSLHSVLDHLLTAGAERTALDDGSRHMSYLALDRQSRRLAGALREAGVGPGKVVALPMPASIDHVVALFATVRAGGIFMPLDPAYPAARLRQIFEQAHPLVIVLRAGDEALGQTLLAEAHAAGGGTSLLVMDSRSEAPPAEPLDILAGEDDAGYLIHTSGSTGKPKMIAGRNKGVSHFVHWEVAELGLGPDVRASIFSPPTFDVSLREILVPLLASGCLVIPDTAVRQDATRLCDWLRLERISLMHAVPSLFRLLTRALREVQDTRAAGAPAGQGLPDLRFTCLAGEPLYGADVAAWQAVSGQSCELINLYGPSETTLAKAFHRVNRESYAPGAIVPIGQAISNSALLILRQNRLADIGEIGEIHIRTPFASLGYWGDEALTAQAFIANPLSEGGADRVYKTGDLGRYRADRSVEFVGRADRQVKVNGVRIELPEIEGAIRSLTRIDEAAAQVWRAADGNNQVAAYYSSKEPVPADQLRAHLEQLLPGPMVPGYLVWMPALPKNLNGKVDRKALPRPEALIQAEQATHAPEGPLETRLCALWAEALGITQVGVESPWLAIGGNSLRAIGLIGRINRELGVSLSIRDFLEQGSVRAQARRIEADRDVAQRGLQTAPQAADYPLSDAQRRLWILSRLDEGQSLYNNVEWLQLHGQLDSAALQRAFQTLVDRHESLRTLYFVGEDGEPRQRITESFPLELAQQVLPAHQAEAVLQEALLHERAQAFNLETGPLLRVRLLRAGPDHAHLLVTLHHIVCDGWSMDQLTLELGAAYRSALDGEALDLPLPAFRPRDLAVWLQTPEARALQDQSHARWKMRLTHADDRAILARDSNAPTVPAHLGARVEVALAPEVQATLQALLAERQATPFMAMAAALSILLYRYGGRDQVVIGTPVAGRNRPGTETVIGFCVNTLPLVLRLSPEQSFGALLAQASRAVTELVADQDMPFERLLADHGDAHDPMVNPLFEVFLAAEPAARAMDWPGLRISEHEVPAPAARYDLGMRFVEDSGGWKILFEYRRKLWGAPFMERLGAHFSRLLESLALAPDAPLAALQMLGQDELRQLQTWSQGPTQALPTEALGALFTQQAARTPQLAAVVSAVDSMVDGKPGDAPRTFSYAELDAQSNAWAQALRQQGVASPAIVGLLLPRGVQWVAALLGILKTGATVLPLDPLHPVERLTQLLTDADVRVLVCDATQLPDWQAAPRLSPQDIAHPVQPLPATPDPAVNSSVDPRDSAYLIYTSGSTGQPKGVLVSHLAFGNMIIDQIASLDVGPGDRLLQFVSPAFDVAMFEVFCALLSGAALTIAAREDLQDAVTYSETRHRLGVNLIGMTPGFLQTLDDSALQGLRLVFTGGEPPLARDIARVRAAGVRYVNAYGPTETAVNAALHEVTDPQVNEPVALGRPTANNALRVVAPDLSPLPWGVSGELLISGAGVAQGYLHRPAATSLAFGQDGDGQRHYRSGDRAVRDSAGQLYFLGRLDGQLKVRGHRIELAEVEFNLHALSGVASARVVARKLGGDNELICYWTATTAGTIGAPAPDGCQLAAALGKRLPAYAVPAHFVRIEQLPLTVNGKLDQSRLPAPQLFGGPPEPGRDEPERALINLWAQVLELPNTQAIGRDSDFFVLGGRSLSANRLTLRVARHLNRVVRLRDLYAAPTPAALLAHLDHQALAVLPRLSESQSAPLSPMQKRLWVISQLQDSGSVYHISGLTRLEGTLDEDAFRQAFADLVERHTVLRTRLVADAQGTPHQIVDPAAVPPWHHHEGAQGPTPNAAASQPFDLAHEWPLRVHLWRRDAHSWDLLLTLHHLAADGWSMPILEQDLAEAYNARLRGQAPSWTPLPAQYRELAAWQAQQAESGQDAPDLAYWRAELAGELPLLDLPIDRPRPPVRRFQGATAEFALEASFVQAIEQLARDQRNTPFAVFLSLIHVLLGRLSGQTDLVMGVPFAGRTHPASEGMIGFFVNTLPLRAPFQRATPFSTHLAGLAQRLLLAEQHQACPFDRLVEAMALQRDTARSPVFDVMVSLTERAPQPPELQGLRLRNLALASEGARCDLWWTLDLSDDQACLRIEYDSDLFDPATLVDWTARLHQLTLAAAHDAAQPVGSLPWLAPLEHARLLSAAGETGERAFVSVLDRFEACAQHTPSALALLTDQDSWTFAELDASAQAWSQRIEAALADQPAIAGQGALGWPLVALTMERGPALVIAILACLKARCAYLPIEPDSPMARLEQLLDDARPALLLCSPGALPNTAASQPPRLCMTAERLQPGPRAARPAVQASDPIYVMYTSGSTGIPKGVVIEQRAVSRLVLDSDYYQPDHGDRILQLSNCAFDGSTFDLYAALTHGLPLALPSRETVLDPVALAAFIDRHAVTVSFMTTALLNQLVDVAPAVLTRLRRLYFGGQEASIDHVRRACALMRPNALVHVYGPTEVTTFSTWHNVLAADLRPHARRLPIGRPIAQTRAYVVDAMGALQATGVPGELWLGGPGVARGYLGQPALSAERFADSPFVPGERLFKSGDLCVQRRDGVIEFIGRQDGQVKIRGYRVEIGEVEGCLTATPEVGKACVMARAANGGNQELVAFITAADPAQAPRLAGLHAQLATQLPPYMLPAAMLLMTALPLNANGKVDQRALAQIGADDARWLKPDSAGDAPAGEREKLLWHVWREALGLDAVGVRDNYFALGGDSIQALQIANRLRNAGWLLQVTDLLRTPTIEALALLIRPLDSASLAPEGPEPLSPALSPMQRWFLAQDFAQPEHFNQSVLLTMPTDLSDARLQQAVDALWQTHSGLRLVFGHGEQGAWQRLLDAAAAPRLHFVDCANGDALSAHAQRAQQGFVPALGPLFQVLRYRLAEGDRLLLIAHHWIIDGVSWRTLIDDLNHALQGRALVAPATSFGRWSQSLQTLALDANELAWWHRQAVMPALALPTIQPSTQTQRSPLARRQHWAFELDATTTQSLTGSGHPAYKTQGDELLIAAWTLALARSLGVHTHTPAAVRIALESHGRVPPGQGQASGVDISRTVGWFTALFPLVLRFSDQALPTLVREVKEGLRALPNRGMGYGVQRWLRDDASLKAAPACEIGFNYLGRFDQDAALAVAPESAGDELAGATVLPNSIDVTLEVREERLCVRLVADCERHPAAWCAELAQTYEAALVELAAHCMDPDAGALSPSDVDLDGLDLSELDALLDGLGQA